MRIAKDIILKIGIIILLCMQIPQQVSAQQPEDLGWEAYSSYYYYNQLTEEEKRIWDEFEEFCEYYMNHDVDITENYRFVKEGEYTRKEIIDWMANFSRIFNVSHPQYYFLDANVTTIEWEENGGAICEFTLESDAYNGAARAEKVREFKEQLEEWNAIIAECDSDYEKVLTMSQLISGEITYDLAETTVTNACEAICKKKTVCYGYSLILEMLCNYAEIDAICITSPPLEGEEPHIWNRVCLDGCWYNIDVTWMDSEQTGINYSYFLKDTEFFNSLTSHTIEEYWNAFDLPECVTDSGSEEYEKISYAIYEMEQTATPQITLVDNGEGYLVSILGEDEECDIYYTLDGTIPSYRNKCQKYSNSFKIGYDTQVKAIAVKDGFIDSEVASTGENITYKIRFDGNGGDIHTVEKIVVNGNNYGYLPHAEREGYLFTGWFTSATAETEIVPSDIVNLSEDCTLYAGWKEKEMKGHIYNGTYQGVHWFIDKTGDLRISGTGDIYSNGEWRVYKDIVKSATVDLSEVTSLKRTFYEFSVLQEVNLEKLDTGKVVNADEMFSNCSSLKSLDLSKCDFTLLESATEMFAEARALQKIETPLNLTIEIELPVGKFRSSLNEEIYILPLNSGESESLNNTLDVSLIPVKKICGDFEFSKIVIDRTGQYDQVFVQIKNTGDEKNGRYFWNLFFMDEEGNLLDVVPISSSDYGAGEYRDYTTETNLIYEGYNDYEIKEKDTKYVITFDAQGAEESGTISGEAIYNGELPMIVMPQRAGYEFQGYFTENNGGGTQYYDKDGNGIQRFQVLNDITLYAYWIEKVEEPEYMITYHLNGGINATDNPITYNRETDTITLKVPKKTGYTFSGWFTEDDYVTEVTQIVTGSSGDLELHAQWIVNRYHISFVGNGATSGEMSTLSNCEYGKEQELPVSTFQRTGYTFTGWNRESDGSGTAYADKAVVTSLTTNNDETVTLYAQWKVNQYHISFVGNGATSGEMSALSNCEYGKEQELPPNTYQRIGYTFIGWNTQSDGMGTTYVDEEIVTNLTETNGETVTLFAQWAPNKYTIEFDKNGATSGKMPSMSDCEYDVSHKLTSNAYKRKGYTFSGWNTQKKGSGKNYKNQEDVKNLTDTNGEMITLYAQWIPIKYTIKFDKNGATSGSMNAMSNRKYGTNYTLSSNKFKRKGYTFTGWNTKKNGKGKSYKNKASVSNLVTANGKSVTLYAQWKTESYKITYKLNGGTNKSSNPKKYDVTTKTITLKAPTRKGYTFKGWYSDSKFKKKVTKIAKGSTGNIIVYAKWVKKR